MPIYSKIDINVDNNNIRSSAFSITNKAKIGDWANYS
jgi:hypothetical protein